jgi:hypothetical protein
MPSAARYVFITRADNNDNRSTATARQTRITCLCDGTAERISRAPFVYRRNGDFQQCTKVSTMATETAV